MSCNHILRKPTATTNPPEHPKDPPNPRNKKSRTHKTGPARACLIKAVTVQGLSYSEAARRHGVTKSLIHKLHHRWLAEGDTAFQARSRRPASTPNRTPESIRARVLTLRHDLTDAGLDAGADTIQEHLTREGITLGRTTIWRIPTVITHDGTVLAEFTLDPTKDYQPQDAENPRT